MNPFEYFVSFYLCGQAGVSMPISEGIMVLFTVLHLNCIKKWKRPYLYILIHFLVSWLFVIVLKAISYCYLRELIVSEVILLPVPIYMFLYSLLISNHKKSHRMYLFLYLLSVQLYSTSFAKSFGAIICYFLNIEYPTWAAEISIIFGKALLFGLCVFLCKKFSITKYDKIPWFYYLVGLLVIVFSALGNHFVTNIKDYKTSLVNQNEVEYSYFIFLVGFLLYFVTLFAYFVCYFGLERERKNSELTNKILSVEEKLSNQNEAENNIDELRKIRHDIRNQFSYLKIMLDQENYDELNQYFAQLNDAVAVPLSTIDCNNTVIKSIIKLEMSKLPKGMKLDYRVATSENLSINSVDLTAILVNLLDNAIEACERDQIQDAVIELNIKEVDSFLYIVVENPIKNKDRADKALLEETSKETKNVHGFGLSIIKTKVEKYNGELKISTDNNIFKIEIMLNI